MHVHSPATTNRLSRCVTYRWARRCHPWFWWCRMRTQYSYRPIYPLGNKPARKTHPGGSVAPRTTTAAGIPPPRKIRPVESGQKPLLALRARPFCRNDDEFLKVKDAYKTRLVTDQKVGIQIPWPIICDKWRRTIIIPKWKTCVRDRPAEVLNLLSGLLSTVHTGSRWKLRPSCLWIKQPSSPTRHIKIRFY